MLLNSEPTSADTDVVDSLENSQPLVSAHCNMKEPSIFMASHQATGQTTALLATALVKVRSESGHIIELKALVDQGSQATFMTERVAQLLKLKRSAIRGTITGVGATQTEVKHTARVEILSRCETFNFKVNTYIMPTQLTSLLPTKRIQTHTWPHLKGIVLADPSFYLPGRIDMLLGVDVCAEIFKGNIRKGAPGSPCAQETRLGWILFGSIHNGTQIEENEIITMHHHVGLHDDILKNMWELEQTKQRLYTKDERLCEEIYENNVKRTEEGRYIVKLPTKNNQLQSTKGNTREKAMKRLHQLERRFGREPSLKENYTEVMNEYLEMKHMEEVPENELNKPAVYLPHHAVVRNDKETTKTRIVFDASCKGCNNISLNDELLVGPLLQDDMRNIVMRWRLKKICFVGDIQKMYRQILVTPEDTDYQRILWRFNTDEEIKDYRMLRVTFGTSSAPYLAVKTLQKIADDEGAETPDAARTIREDFYMDDLMSGRDTVEEALEVATDISKMLEKGGFRLQKWSSNNAEFLKRIEPENRSSKILVNIKVDGTIKTLGLCWNIGNDVLQYHFNIPPAPERTTKRIMLSEIQRFFDPLGWLAPAILPAKLLMQKMWLRGLSWDEEVEPEIKREWVELRQAFEQLDSIKLKRWLHTTENNKQRTTLHGFCDASNKSYAAVVYLRTISEDGDITTNIVAAKTRVAPVKPVSVPRLELCGALILSRLLKQISEATRIPMSQVFAWTDSTIVLSWLIGDPNRWNIFVSNRVVEIIDNVGNQIWNHVTSEENPADKASRGQTLSQLIENKLWWEGPKWLKNEVIEFAHPRLEPTNLEKRKKIQINLKIANVMEKKIDLKIFNSIDELKRVIVYMLRMLNSKKKPENVSNHITTEELEDALQKIIKSIQEDEFEDEILKLKQQKIVSKKSNLRSLNPILDEKQILRVGGRLRHADIAEQRKNPIILGIKNALVPLLIADAHKRTLHGGVELMTCYLRARYWIIRVKPSIRSHIHKCLICAKHNAAVQRQLMGDLPKVRVTPARPFLHSGVDFAGPIQVLISKGRGAKTRKAYISVFICMSTKAVHLELVGEMTSEAFIAAFKRFVSRRGKCNHLWSDQGRNFVGANKELFAAWKEAKLEFDEQITDSLISEGTQWHFIPAYSPNFGGLWESAGVKSMKHHLKRILTSNLTFEEMTTLLCQIEACLNSRPLTSVDDAETDPLTPGHFLIGEAPILVPEPYLQNDKISHLSRWQYTQKLLKDFWKRWQEEYLTKLQQRHKWQNKEKEFNIGDILLIKDDHSPPGKWALARVVEKHPGLDGMTRVYSVKSGDHIVKRSVSKLCSLPIETNDV